MGGPSKFKGLSYGLKQACAKNVQAHSLRQKKDTLLLTYENLVTIPSRQKI